MPVIATNIERLRTLPDAWIVTHADIGGPLLRRLGGIHRDQMRRVFALEAKGELYPWPRLTPHYQMAKRRMLGRKGKILVLSGEMKERFINSGRGQYIQRYIPPNIIFGAESSIAARHFLGTPPLPKRDMIYKSTKQLRELRQGILDWWRNERVPQLQRGTQRLLARARGGK